MRFISIRYIFLIILFSFTYRIYTRESNPPFLKYVHHPWVDSVFNSLSQEERIAQLIWVYAFSNREIGHEVYLSNVIEKTGVGGVVFSG